MRKIIGSISVGGYTNIHFKYCFPNQFIDEFMLELNGLSF